MALTTGILIAKSSKKGHVYETAVNADDAAVSAMWTQIYTTTPGILADGTKLKSARLFNPAVYSATGELIPTKSKLVYGAGGQWDDPASDVDFAALGSALGDPGTCAMNALRIAANVVAHETVTLVGAGLYHGITEVYEFTADGTLTAPTNIPVDVSSGLTPTIATTKLVAAINASTNLGIFAEKISNNEVVVYKTAAGVDVTGCTETMTGSGNTWSAAAFYGGSALGSEKRNQSQSRVPTAQEVLTGTMHFIFPFQPKNPIVQVRVTSSGVPTAWVGAAIPNGNRLTLDNTGGTDWAATDTVTVEVTD